ncbi:MAG: DnaJ domain-containing protein [bacterium]
MTGRARDYYQILEVTASASGAEIRAAFLDLARRHHPDRAPAEEREAAQASFQALTQAYETLADPVKRGEYDTQRRLQQVWRPPRAATRGWAAMHEVVAARWGVSRVPWYGWLIVGPFLIAMGAVVLAQFFFYYTFLIGMVVLVPSSLAYYGWRVWPPLGVLIAVPMVWMWGFLIQGTVRNIRREKRDRQRESWREAR